MKIWTCKIGEVREGVLTQGADWAMRMAIRKAYEEITGRSPDYIFSGWEGELTEIEREIAFPTE